IEHGDVRAQLSGSPDSLLAVGGFADDLESLALQKTFHTLAEDQVIVAEKDPKRHAPSPQGIVRRNSVPWPRTETISRVPPKTSSRSRSSLNPRPCLPWSPATLATSKPIPLSRIEQQIRRASCCR